MSTAEQWAALEALDLTHIADERARQGFGLLLNLVEDQAHEIRDLRAELDRLRAEIRRLKGTPGRPPAATAPSAAPPRPHSSEAERHTPQPHTKPPKTARIVVDRHEVLTVDPAVLPADAVFKGYDTVIVQDIRLRTDNICFAKQVYYSPSEHRSYRAALPPGYQGEFGPGIKALSLTLYYGGLLSEPKLAEFWANVGIRISAGQIAQLLIHDQDEFHAEKAAMYAAGLRSSPWQGSDDTGTSINGVGAHCHVMSNPLYTCYQTYPGKDRLTVLDVLRHGQKRQFMCNTRALAYAAQLGLSRKLQERLGRLPRDAILSEATVETWLDAQEPALGPTQRRWIKDSLALAAYQGQTDWPVVAVLLSDDAPQYGLVAEEHALCWVHIGRHFKQLVPVLAAHRAALADFEAQLWAYYRALRAYQEQPSAAERARLTAEFDRLFSTETGYRALDERIARTAGHKAELLVVLEHPEVPLHNNACELGARGRVRKRDVSFGPRTAAGAKAWDTFQSLAATTKKLGISFYAYIADRVGQRATIPPLAEVIDQRAQELNLRASWPNG